MITPKREDFLKLADSFNLVPVYKSIPCDFDTALTLFIKTKGQFLLESVENGNNVGRYSIIALGKKTEFRLNKKELTITEYLSNNGKEKSKIQKNHDNPIDEIRKYFSKFNPSPTPSDFPPFYGGAIGYLGYETVTYYEQIPTNEGLNDIPDGVLILPEIFLILDNIKRNVSIIHPTHIDKDKEKNDQNYKEACEKINRIHTLINQPLSYKPPVNWKDTDESIQSNFSKKEFMNQVEKCKQHIYDGDIIQAVISQQFSTKTKAPPFELYRALRQLNPSPYLYFLDFEDFQLIGSSPEVMVRVDEEEILLKPIAGTRPRGLTQAQDKQLAEELLSDPKERAEHLMLVDLGRNDLGRIAQIGSVQVREYMTVEYYSHVMHIVSSINATLKKGKNAFDVVSATFPAGTLSGAPKIRAMEIISDLENTRRGPYGGMVLSYGYQGTLNSCITIRTILLNKGKAVVQAGAGIVLDSDPEKEFLETENKAKALFKTIELTRKRFTNG